MTLRNTARLAGIAYLLYFAIGIPSLILMNRVTSGDGIAAKLANIAMHAPIVRTVALLSIGAALCAITLGVTLYVLTRDENREIALIAMFCRVAEGITGSLHYVSALSLLSVATATAGAAAADKTALLAAGSAALAESRLGPGAILFAIGSTLFCCLFLRARTIPAWLAWLGIFASALLAVWLPLLVLRAVEDNWYVWMPGLVFELTFAFWLIFKGVAPHARPLES